MVLPAVLAAPEVIAAVIAVIGVLFKNKWLVLIGAGTFIYFLGLFVDIPFFVWIIIAVIFFFWITSQGKGK